MPVISFVPEYDAYTQAGVDEGGGVLINMRVAVSMPATEAGAAPASEGEAPAAAGAAAAGDAPEKRSTAEGKKGKRPSKAAAAAADSKPPAASGAESSTSDPAAAAGSATEAGKGHGEPTEDRNAVAVAVAIDHSGSMNSADRLPVALEASCFVVDDLTPGDALVICAFDDTVKVKYDAGSVTPAAAAAAKGAINSIRAEGGTDIFGAALQCVTRLAARPADGRGAFVILASDGQHNAGSTQQGEVVRAAKASSIRIYTIGIGAGHDAGTLSALAKATGGAYVGITSPEGLASAVGGMLAVEQTLRASEAVLHLTIPHAIAGSPGRAATNYQPPPPVPGASGAAAPVGAARRARRGSTPAAAAAAPGGGGDPAAAAEEEEEDPAAPAGGRTSLLSRAAAAAVGAVSAVASAVTSYLSPASAAAAADPTAAAAGDGDSAAPAAAAPGGHGPFTAPSPATIGGARIVAVHTSFPSAVTPDGKNASIRLGCLAEGESRELLVTVLADRVTAEALIGAGAVDAASGPAAVPALVHHVALAGRVEYLQHGPRARAAGAAGAATAKVRTGDSFLTVPRVAGPAVEASAATALAGEAALAAARARVAAGPVGIVGSKANAAVLPAPASEAAPAGGPGAASSSAVPKRSRVFVDTRVRVRAGIVLEAAAAAPGEGAAGYGHYGRGHGYAHAADSGSDSGSDGDVDLTGLRGHRAAAHAHAHAGAPPTPRRISPGPAGFHTAVAKPHAAAVPAAALHAPKRPRRAGGGAPLPGIDTPDPSQVLSAQVTRAAAPAAATLTTAAAPAAEITAVAAPAPAAPADWRTLSGRRLLQEAVAEMDRQDRADASMDVFTAVRNDIEAAARDMAAARSGRGNGAAAASAAMMYAGQSACVSSAVASPATACYATKSVTMRSAVYRSKQTTTITSNPTGHYSGGGGGPGGGSGGAAGVP